MSTAGPSPASSAATPKLPLRDVFATPPFWLARTITFTKSAFRAFAKGTKARKALIAG
jgi:hypothetical protein